MPIIDTVGLEERCFHSFPRPLDHQVSQQLQSWFELQKQMLPGPALPLSAHGLTKHFLWGHHQWKIWKRWPQWDSTLQLMCEWAQRPSWHRLLVALESTYSIAEWKQPMSILQLGSIGEDSFDRLLDKQIDRALAYARARPRFDIELAQVFLPLYYGYYFDRNFLIGAMIATELVMAVGMGPSLASVEKTFIYQNGHQANEEGYFSRLQEQGPARMKAWQEILRALGTNRSLHAQSLSLGLEMALNSWGHYLSRFPKQAVPSPAPQRETPELHLVH